MRISALLLVCCVLTSTYARTITWTGAAGNSLWSFANNWDVNSVPTNADDVIINPLGGSSISISSPAQARSVNLAGGSYRQTLTLVSSLSVGDGGLLIRQSGTLQISTNNDLPLSSTGTVRAQAGGVIVYQSGDITGPGQYIVDSGAGIVFSGPALKLIDRANITINGEATIQPTTIQFTRGGALYNYGNCTAIGQITIFASDKGNFFYSAGNFTYQGSNVVQPLTIQVSTQFDKDLNIISGGLLIEDEVKFNGVVYLPQGTIATVQAGAAYAWFRSVQGAGSFTVYSPTEVASLNVSWTTVSDSGSLTVSAPSVTKSLSLSGKLVINLAVTLTATDVSVIAGTITGAGRLVTSGNFELAAASSSNINNFISAEVRVGGRGYVTGVVQVLFADAGNLHILSTGSFTLSATVTFLKQSGNPVVTNEGTFQMNLPVGAVFTSNVDYSGASGSLVFTGGKAIFQGDKVTAGKVGITNTLVAFSTAEAHFGDVSGTGSVNISADPATASTFGAVNLAYFGVVNGKVNVGSVSLNTLEVFNSGVLSLTASASQQATIFNFYGGEVGSVPRQQLNSATVRAYCYTPSTIRNIVLNTKRFELTPGVASSALLIEGAGSILAGSA